jgi:quercetin dioxygenase-like cupin family protein
MSSSIYFDNYNVTILQNVINTGGSVLFSSFEKTPSNTINKNIYNILVCGILQPLDNKYDIVFDLSNQNINDIEFKGPLIGTLRICDKILNMSKISKYSYEKETKKLSITFHLSFKITVDTLFSITMSLASNDTNNSCSLSTLSQITNGFTEINGQTPPGELATLVDSNRMISTKNVNGDCVLMVKSTRKVGTRVGIHVHKYGGYTLILKGTMTDFVQGKEIKKYSGSGYYMPPCTPMSAGNLGDEDVELIDIFIGPPGEPFIEILEPNWTFDRIEKFPE